MGRGTPTCLMGLPNDVATVNGRDTLRHDLWGWGCNPTGSKLPNAENKFLHPKWQWWAVGGEPRSDPLGVLPPETQRGYDANVKLRPLALGDLVLRKVMGAAKDPSWGKLGPNWKGPFRITSVTRIGAYYLEDLDERAVPRPWNVNNLKMYYY